jgi:16S rRNA (uracil1498-N3)-methyltransferase
VGVSGSLYRQRCIINLADAGQVPRWQRVILEAASSGRAGSPPSFLLSCSPACGAWRWQGATLILENETAFSSKWMLRPGRERPCISLFIGPEGGFTTEEVELAADYGIRAVTLGPRILRAETAGIAAAAAIFLRDG